MKLKQHRRSPRPARGAMPGPRESQTTFMLNHFPTYWYACVGEPAALHSPETGKCKRLIIEDTDSSLTADDVKNEVRAFVGFSTNTAMRWYEFKTVEIKEPDGPACADRGQRVRIWSVAKAPGGQPDL